MNKTLLGHLSLISVNIIYGLNYSIAKDVLGTYIQPSGFILLRVVGAMLLFWLTAVFMRSQKLDRSDRVRVILCGIFGVGINQLLFFKGLIITSPINASIMMVCTPILVVIMGYVSAVEKFTLIRLLGIFLGLGGALFLILNPLKGASTQSGNIGDLFILINACSFGLYLILVKPLMQKYHTITVVKWVFLVGFIVVLPFGYHELKVVNWHTMPNYVYAEVFFVVFATTYLAYILNTYSLKNLSASLVSVYTYSQPLLAAFFAIIWGKDQLDLVKVIAAVLIFSGVFLAGKSNMGQSLITEDAKK